MGRRNTPTIRQLRDIYTLVGECRELGADPRLWREHLADGLVRLVPDSVALVYELYPSLLARGEVAPALIDCGWEEDSRRAAFLAYLASGESASNPLLKYIMTKNAPMIATRASHVLSLEQWRQSNVSDYIDEAGLDLDCLTTASRLDGKRNVVTVHRHKGRQTLMLREMRLLALLHREIREELGTRLASFGEPSVLELPLRARQVLHHLLRGESVANIAAELNISKHTANDYTKMIHRHLCVRSRGELLYKFGGLVRGRHGGRYFAGGE